MGALEVESWLELDTLQTNSNSGTYTQALSVNVTKPSQAKPNKQWKSSNLQADHTHTERERAKETALGRVFAENWTLWPVTCDISPSDSISNTVSDLNKYLAFYFVAAAAASSHHVPSQICPAQTNCCASDIDVFHCLPFVTSQTLHNLMLDSHICLKSIGGWAEGWPRSKMICFCARKIDG